MPTNNYYKCLGLCCFIKDALLATSEPGVEEAFRDLHLLRYLGQVRGDQFCYDYHMKPIEGVDPRKEYARRLHIQFNRVIWYNLFDIHQELEEGNIWINIWQISPHDAQYNYDGFWLFNGMSEPVLKEMKSPPKVVGTRNIIICK
jgi:hypothetical protein